MGGMMMATRSRLIGAAFVVSASPVLAQDTATPEGAAALVAEACPFGGLDGPSSARVDGPAEGVSLRLASRDGFRSCELTLPERGEAFHGAMADALAALIDERHGIADVESLEDGVIWRWEPEEGLRGQAELSLAPTGDVVAVVSLERGELMENSE
jgi:hypothetical protein